jgi:hypothetical protein
MTLKMSTAKPRARVSRPKLSSMPSPSPIVRPSVRQSARPGAVKPNPIKRYEPARRSSNSGNKSLFVVVMDNNIFIYRNIVYSNLFFSY